MLDEERRLEESAARRKNWQRFGTYLSERQWGTVREDYSATGECWSYFPYEHSLLRAYRWGEDGLLGLCDREGRLCFALALWNGRDPHLKERLFGLTGPEGSHGEDVKEVYHYLDQTPTCSYAKGLYRYPLCAFPYEQLRREAGPRDRRKREVELEDLGVFEGGAFVDVVVEYAKEDPDDVLVRITLTNRSAAPASLRLLPTLWFRNVWSWGRAGDGSEDIGAGAVRPRLAATAETRLLASHPTLGDFALAAGPGPDGRDPALLFTENDTNHPVLFGAPGESRFTKDAFHRFVVHRETTAVNPARSGTKAAADYSIDLAPSGSATVRLRLTAVELGRRGIDATFDAIFARRIEEADAFYAARIDERLDADERAVARAAYAGLLWSKQFYHYVVKDWLDGDPGQPPPPPQRREGRNSDWLHLYNRDVVSMPDKWEYPWYAAWDLAFHMLAFAPVDARFAQRQLELFLREWYMHPSGQIPAYEFALSDVNPPVHAWACWRVYKMSGKRGKRDRGFLESVFHKLLLNFTWWVNRKDVDGNHLFAGGFLGLDNIGVFDRSKPLPSGGRLEQADGTAWMSFYCVTMMVMALELARANPTYEDMASKFFEHFVAIADAINQLGGSGLYDEVDGFYYDQLHLDGGRIPLRVRSLVGLIPLLTCVVIERDAADAMPSFKRRLEWFLTHRADLARQISWMEHGNDGSKDRLLLAIPTRERLVRILRYALDEGEFLSPFGIRSLSKVHAEKPFVLSIGGAEHRVDYDPGESTTGMFGGNSNWRGPIWLPMNYLIIEALERWHYFYGDSLKVECPVGSGQMLDLNQVAIELARRNARLFVEGPDGRRPCLGETKLDQDLLLFHEYFHADTGRGCGAAHQTGWTALIVRLMERVAKTRPPPRG